MRTRLPLRACSTALLLAVVTAAISVSASALPVQPQITMTNLDPAGLFVSPVATTISSNGIIAGYGRAANGNSDLWRWTPANGITDLGTVNGAPTSYPWGINSKGAIAGSSPAGQPGPPDDGFFWSERSGVVDLGPLLPASMDSDAYSLNDAGQVAGGYHVDLGGGTIVSRSFVWSQREGMTLLPTLGGNQSFTSMVNGKGQVTGESTLPGETASHAFIWTKAAGMTDLGTLGGAYSTAGPINDTGQVAGTSRTLDGRTDVFLWSAKTGMLDLGNLGGAHGYVAAINSSGAIAGRWQLQGETTVHAFYWSAKTGMLDLGTLGGDSSTVTGLSDNGIVVGASETPDGSTHAFAWTGATGMLDLTPGAVLSVADAVSAKGQIVGYAVNTSLQTQAFLWQLPGFGK